MCECILASLWLFFFYKSEFKVSRLHVFPMKNLLKGPSGTCVLCDTINTQVVFCVLDIKDNGSSMFAGQSGFTISDILFFLQLATRAAI